MLKKGAGRAAVLPLIGGRRCLDFVNTLGWRGAEAPEEHIACYDDLLAWSLHAGSLNEDDVQRLALEAMEHPARAGSSFAKALALREAMHRTFASLASAQAPGDADLGVINDELGDALSHLRIARFDDRFGWRWDRSTLSLDRPLWPIARSCAELLASSDIANVRECAGHPCGWLFLDSSKNRSRRWCDSRDCGNRVRAQRHYARKRTARTAFAGGSAL
jgi:predicted RNA-binding Zn ribbon-like protein